MKALNCIELAGQEKWSETLQYIEVDDQSQAIMKF